MTQQRHKHYDMIMAWAEGHLIQARAMDTDTWFKASKPNWQRDTEYRIEPPIDEDAIKLLEFEIAERQKQIKLLRENRL